MGLRTASLVLLALVGIAALVLWLALGAADGGLSARRALERDQLAPVSVDEPCIGTYREGGEELVLRGDGTYGESGFEPDEHLLLPAHVEGTWTRTSSSVSLLPSVPRHAARELTFGRLDGTLALLGEFNTWRRAPER